MGLVEELERLNDLKQSGAISEDEYEDAKARILDNWSEGYQYENRVSSDESLWGMLIHLSQFCGYIVPFAGFITPIVLWQIKKKESHILDLHGRIVANWIITAALFGVLSGILCFVFIGIPLLIGFIWWIARGRKKES